MLNNDKIISYCVSKLGQEKTKNMEEFEIIESMKIKGLEEDFVAFFSQFRPSEGDEAAQVKFDDFILSQKASTECYVKLSDETLQSKDLFYIPIVISEDDTVVDFDKIKQYVLNGYAQDFVDAYIDINKHLLPVSELPLYNYQQKKFLSTEFEDTSNDTAYSKGIYFVVGSIIFDPEEEDFPSSSISDHDKAIIENGVSLQVDNFGVLGCYDLVTTALLAIHIYEQSQIIKANQSRDIEGIFYGEEAVVIHYSNGPNAELNLLPKTSYVENCEIEYELNTIRLLLQ